MKRLFDDTRLLDEAARKRLGFSDDVMMENAAAALQAQIKCFDEDERTSCGDQTSFRKQSAPRVLIACGAGDNGGDGYALARRIENCVVWSVLPPKSASCIRQKERAEKAGVRFFEGDVMAFKAAFCERYGAFGDGCGASDGKCGTFAKKCGVSGESCGTSGKECGKFGLSDAFDIVVDCVFGSGFHGAPNEAVSNVMQFLNSLDAYKIACDVPSCLSCADSVFSTSIFKADVTVTMGALKKVLYDEYSKDYVGSIVCADLGVTRAVFESLVDDTIGESPAMDGSADADKGASQETFLLEQTDFAAPKRERACVHKGSFGHCAVCTGEKSGAGIIAGEASLAYGAGLVTLVPGTAYCPPELMTANELPKNVTAVAFGMGLGRGEPAGKTASARLEQLAKLKVPCVLDADIFYAECLPGFLSDNCGKMPIVLTPHPKEFLALIELCGLTEVSSESNIESPDSPAIFAKPTAEFAELSKLSPGQKVQFAVKNRQTLSAAFCRKYPGVVLLVKGATPLISVCEDGKTKQFVNPLGKNCLAKGGSGDVLSGLICALLAQGYSALNAAIQGSLAHSLASQRITTDYGMTPFMLIEAARFL